MQKIHFEIDNTIKDRFLKKKILKKYKNYGIHQSNVIVAIGGDGFMLKILKKYQKFNHAFYGINKGTYGFLMNKFKLNNLHQNISRAREIKISPLEMKVTTKDNKKIVAIAVNEVSLLRQSKQTASLQILNGKNVLIKKLISDGVLVSTPAGSTAYNLSVRGPILSLDSNKMAITPISPFRPRRWIGKIVSSSSIITVTNLDIKKRPVSVVADNVEVRNMRSVKVKINKSIKFRLLYDKGNTLIKKIKLEQFKKNKT